jgi:hypothetical protein
LDGSRHVGKWLVLREEPRGARGSEPVLGEIPLLSSVREGNVEPFAGRQEGVDAFRVGAVSGDVCGKTPVPSLTGAVEERAVVGAVASQDVSKPLGDRGCGFVVFFVPCRGVWHGEDGEGVDVGVPPHGGLDECGVSGGDSDIPGDRLATSIRDEESGVPSTVVSEAFRASEVASFRGGVGTEALIGGRDGPVVLLEALELGVDVGHASGEAFFDRLREARNFACGVFGMSDEGVEARGGGDGAQVFEDACKGEGVL